MGNVAGIIQVSRVDRVDQVVRERGWSLAVARELAIEFGCSLNTVYRYWNRCRRWTQATMKAGDLEMWRAQQVQQLTEVAIEARKAKDYKSTVRAIEAQAKIIGTIAPLKVEHGGTVGVQLALPVPVEYPRVVEASSVVVDTPAGVPSPLLAAHADAPDPERAGGLPQPVEQGADTDP